MREEIEMMDVNLVRYHIKNESNLFMKKVLEYSNESDKRKSRSDDPKGSKVKLVTFFKLKYS